MRKNYVLWFLAMLLSIGMVYGQGKKHNNKAEVIIGTGTTTDKGIPVEPYYGYSYSQFIYLASDLGASEDIKKISFYFAGSSLSNSNEWVIYMGHTAKTAFDNNTDWIDVSTLTEVYNATFADPGTSGWVEFDITDFTYNGTDNLIIAVDENASSYNSTGDDFYCSTSPGDQSIYYRSDGTNPDPGSPVTASGVQAFLPNIKLNKGIDPPFAFTFTPDSDEIVATGETHNYVMGIENTGTSNDTYDLAVASANGWTYTILADDETTVISSLSVDAGTDEVFVVQVLVPGDADMGDEDEVTITVTSQGDGSVSDSEIITTTALATLGLGDSETFDSYLPLGWSEFTGLLDAPTTTSGTSSLWTADGFANDGTTGSARLEIYSTNRKEWLATPTIDLGDAGNLQIEFDLALTYWSSVAEDNLGEDDKLAIVISTDNGTTWSSANTLLVYGSEDAISNTGDHVVISLASYTGDVKIGFYGESTVSGGDVNVYIDNFEISEIPAGPTFDINKDEVNFDILAVGNSHVETFSISNNGAADLVISAVSYSELSAAFSLNESLPLTITPGNSSDLTITFAPTAAQFVNLEITVSDNISKADNMISFSGNVVPADYVTESFEGDDFPPAGWMKEDGSSWTTSTLHARQGSKSAYNYLSASDNEYLLTPFLEVTSGDTLYFSVKATSASKSLNIIYGADTEDMENWTVLTDPAIDVSTEWVDYKLALDFTADVYLAFEGIATSDGSIYLDLITTPPAKAIAPNCVTLDAPADLSTDFVVNPTLEWTAVFPGGIPDGYKVYLGTDADPLNNGSEIYDGTNTEFEISAALNYETTYYWTVIAYNATGDATTCDTYSFTTMSDPTMSTLPYAESFESWAPDNWTLDPSSGTGSWSQNSGTSYGPGSPQDGSYAAMFNNYNYSASTTGSLITPPLDLSAYGTTRVSFYWWNGDGATTPAGLAVYTSSDDGSTWDLADEWDAYGTSDWELYTLDIANTINKVKITATSDYGSKNTYIDNFTMSEIVDYEFISYEPSDGATETNSYAIYQLVIENAGAQNDSYDLSVVSENTWTSAIYAKDSVTSISSIAINSGVKDTIVIKTLVPADAAMGDTDNLTFTITSQADAAVSSDVIIQTTAIATIAQPYTENFDALSTPELPLGWTSIIESTSSYAVVETQTTNNSAPNAVKLYNSGDASAELVLVSPKVSSFEATKLTFMYKAVASVSFKVGAITDPTDISTFTELETIWGNTDWTEFNMDLGSLADNLHLAIYHDCLATYQSVFIDDFELSEQLAYDFTISVETGTSIWIGENEMYLAEISNSGSSNDSYTLAATSAKGWDYQILAKDSTTAITYIAINSYVQDSVFFKVTVPEEAERGAVDTLALTFTSAGNAAVLLDTIFTTADAPFRLPYNQDFSNASADGWTGTMAIGETHGNPDFGIFKNVYGSTTSAYVNMPIIGACSSNSILTFDYRWVDYTSYPDNAHDPDGSGNALYVMVSTDYGENYNDTVLTRDTSNHVVSNEFVTVTADLSAYEGQDVKIKIKQVRTAGDFYVDLDNFGLYDYIPYNVSMLLPADQKVLHGSSHYYLVKVKNIGSSNDTYNISKVSSNSWTYNTYAADSTSSISTISVNAGETDTLVIKVNVPAETELNDLDELTLSLTSQNDAEVNTEGVITTTVLGPVELPYVQNFDNYVPENWTEQKGLLDSPTTFSSSTSKWYKEGFANQGSEGAAGCNIYSTNTYDWILTPIFNLGYGEVIYQLSFDVAFTDYANSNQPETIGDDDRFVVVISTDGGNTWNETDSIFVLDKARLQELATSGPSGENIKVNLEGYTGEVRFGFYAESLVSNADNDIFIDNVVIDTLPGDDASLADLLVDGETIAGFSSIVYEYNLVLPYGTTDIPVISAETSDAAATKVITQATELPGTASVVVTAENQEVTETYSVNYTIEANTDATLSDIQIDGVSINGFDEATFAYVIDLACGTETPVVTGIATDSNAEINDVNQANFSSNDTIAILKVTAEDGETQLSYQIKFKVAAPDFYEMLASEISDAGFTLNLSPAYAGLTAENFVLSASQVTSTVIPIDGLTETNGGEMYNFEAELVQGQGYLLNVVGLDACTDFSDDVVVFVPNLAQLLVSTTTPLDQALDVSPMAHIEVIFDEPIDTIDLSTISLNPAPEWISAGYNADKTGIVIIHEQLEFNTTYTVTIPADIATGVNSEDNNDAYAWSFTTREVSTNALLSNLSLNGIDMDDFEVETFAYSRIFPYGSTEIPVVEATVQDANASIVITQAESLPGTATVVVTAEDGLTEQSYTIEFLLEPNDDASLSAITVNEENLESFDPALYLYNVILDPGTTDIPIVAAVATDNHATVVVTQASELPGSATITVTAEDETTELSYTINFTVALSSDAQLASISINDEALETFASDVYAYNVELAYGTTTLPVVSAIANYADASVSIEQVVELPGDATVTVVAEDGNTSRVYTIAFSVALNSDASLSSLTVNEEAVEGFDPAIFTYSMTLPYSADLPVVEAAASDPNATVGVNQATTLPGSAVVNIVAEDGETELSYTISFDLEDPATDATLAEIQIDGEAIEDFSAEVLSYSFTLPYGTSIVPEVTATTADVNASVEISAATSLPGTTTLLVIAEDGVTTESYAVEFNLEDPATDATLSSLTINDVLLETFDANVFNYEIAIPSSVTDLPIIGGTLSDGNASMVETQVDAIPGTATIVVTAEDGETTHTYAVSFYRTFTVTFTIVNNETLIADAEITFNDETLTTSAQGVVSFDNVLAGEALAFIVSKDGYETYNGTVDVDDDESITVNIIPISIADEVFANLSVYPNPTADIITISGAFNGNLELLVKDITGKIIFTKTSENNSEVLDLSNEQAGIYFITIKSGSKSVSYKVVKF